MLQQQVALDRAIEQVLEQVRAELERLYSQNDVGKIEVDVGPDQIVVKSTPVRKHTPVRLK